MASDRFLHMAALLPHWDENFIINAFAKMGEYVLRVQMITYEGRPASFCFVEFPDDYSAIHAMHKLDGKWIPNSIPPVKFHLSRTLQPGENWWKEYFTLFVRHLPPHVDNYLLYKGFASRNPSVRLAIVLRDGNGKSKRCGIVGFAKENEQKDALINMNGFSGFGGRPIGVEPKRNKHSSPKAETSSSLVQHMAANSAIRSGQPQPSTSATETLQDYSQYNVQFMQNYAASPAASQNCGNFYSSLIPWDNYTQQQPIAWQSTTMPAANTPPLMPTTAIGMQTAHLSEHVGQEQPNPWQYAAMPAADTPSLLPTQPIGMQMAHSSQHVGRQQSNPWQSSTTPAANTPAQLPTQPIGMQMAHSSQHVGQQQSNPWQSSMMPAANTPPQLPTSPISMQMAHFSGHGDQQQPNPRQYAIMPAANTSTLLPIQPIGMEMAHSSQRVGQQQPNTWQPAMMPAAYQGAGQPERNQSFYQLFPLRRWPNVD